MREIFALDVETAGTSPEVTKFAGLEPWRVWRGKGHVTDVGICRPDGSTLSLSRREMGDEFFQRSLVAALEELRGKIVYCQNTVFDLAWMLGSLKGSRTEKIPGVIRDIRWQDTKLLAKWLVNGQYAEEVRFSYSLVNLVKTFLPGHPMTEEFIKIKSGDVPEAGQNPEYWEKRNLYDVILTRVLAEFLEEKLPAGQRMGYGTEMRNLLPVANSWLTGIHIDQDRLLQVEREFIQAQKEIIARINIAPSVITSPKQLGHLLFNEMGLTPLNRTPTGTPSTAADDLKMITYVLSQSQDERAPILRDICRYKQIATVMSKYVAACKEALQHTGDGFIYGCPMIFGTYTGRFTYSSKTLDTWRTGIALHQIPRRDKAIRSFLAPPEGYEVYEADAAGQESRLMAIRSGDPNMLKVFSDGLDFHAVTGSNVVGREYDEFMEQYRAGEPRTVEERQYGKLTNLSCNYRIGGKALAKKAFDDYDIVMTIEQGMFLVKGFSRTYQGVPKYWDDVIKFAKANGYTEAFGGRRYKINRWQDKVWESESSAINLPIQGGGASMKNIAIAEIHDADDECFFSLDLHDASFVWVPSDKVEEKRKILNDTLANIDYSKYWGFKPLIPLPYDSKVGHNFSEVK